MLQVKRAIKACVHAGLAISIATGCSKKSESTPATTDPAASSGAGGTGSLNISLTPEIDMSCGGENCFYKSSSSLNLDGGQTSGYLDTMQLMTWLVVGFPKEAGMYDSLTDDQKTIIPEGGFVSAMETVRKKVTEAAVAAYKADASFKKCADVPATGTFTVESGVEATWTKPILSAPKGNETPGAYEKALTVTMDDVDYRLEFNCDIDSMAVASKRGEDVYYVFYYEKDASNVIHAEFDMWGTGGVVSDAEIIMQFIMTKTADNDVEGWLSRTGPKSDGSSLHLGFRYVVKKLGSDDKVAFYQTGLGDAREGDNSAIQYTDWKVSPYVTGEGISSNSQQTSFESQGCGASWTATSEETTIGPLCTGIELSKAPVSGLSDESNASLLWVDSNLPTMVKAIFN